MTIVAEEYGYVIGVGTRARTHTYAIVDTSTGVYIATESFPITAAFDRAVVWMKRNTNGDSPPLRGLRPTGSGSEDGRHPRR